MTTFVSRLNQFFEEKNQEIDQLEQGLLKKEAITYNLKQYLVLTPAFIFILLNLNPLFLLLPALIGIVLDFINSLSKAFWITSSLVTIPACVGIYFGLGWALSFINLILPATRVFSYETIIYALIFGRFMMSPIINSGIVSLYVDLKTEAIANHE